MWFESTTALFRGMYSPYATKSNIFGQERRVYYTVHRTVYRTWAQSAHGPVLLCPSKSELPSLNKQQIHRKIIVNLPHHPFKSINISGSESHAKDWSGALEVVIPPGKGRLFPEVLGMLNGPLE